MFDKLMVDEAFLLWAGLGLKRDELVEDIRHYSGVYPECERLIGVLDGLREKLRSKAMAYYEQDTE